MRSANFQVLSRVSSQYLSYIALNMGHLQALFLISPLQYTLGLIVEICLCYICVSLSLSFDSLRPSLPLNCLNLGPLWDLLALQ